MITNARQRSKSSWELNSSKKAINKIEERKQTNIQKQKNH